MLLLPIALCAIAFLAAYFAGQKSLVGGLIVVLTAGFFYGVMRANIPSTASFFVFDIAVLGFYAAQLPLSFRGAFARSHGSLLIWVMILIAWPLVLMALPFQEPLVQLVGLRGHVLLLPFVIIGARLSGDDFYRIGRVCAVLVLLTFAFALAELTWGLERFYPRNAVTELIYARTDLRYVNFLRIPATFSSAHAFAGALMTSFPFIAGAWVRSRRRSHSMLFLAAALASIIGVAMTGSRTHALLLIVLIVLSLLTAGVGARFRLTWAVVILLAAALVVSDSRLQRFMTLQNTSLVRGRMAQSMNLSFFEAVVTYPMGNGLGSGGTNMPSFLQQQLRRPVVLENEYARIALEQGLIGLFLWITFLLWVFVRRGANDSDPWRLGSRLSWASGFSLFATAWIGLGLLNAVPQAVLMFLGMGWMIARSRAVARHDDDPRTSLAGLRHEPVRVAGD